MLFRPSRLIAPLVAAVAALFVTACATAPAPSLSDAPAMSAADAFERDREAILAMTGDYKVTFDFTETVAFVDGYEPKAPYITGGDEIVRVIADEGDYISLQHILVVGGDEKFPVKHWRQDWIFEPEAVFDFVGGNAWKKRMLSAEERRGTWAQIVYQVDDAPRYAGVAAWSHANGVSEWASPPSWRPLPRRDAAKRDDYHAIVAVNRHAITPKGWVHEQDNTKLMLGGTPQALVREVGVNRYVKDSSFEVSVGEDYWAATEDFWAVIRAEWTRLESAHDAFGLTIQGEPEELYMQILGLASMVADGESSSDDAARDAIDIINAYTTADIGDIKGRLSGVASGTGY